MTVTIRLVRTEEYERAGEVTAEAYLASYGELSDEYLASLRDVATRVRTGDVWVAVDEDAQIIGTVWVSRPNRPLNPDIARPGETDFRQLAVAPAARGKGVGEALTRHVITLAQERGSHRVVMNSGPEMTGAHALYAKLGFDRLPEREGRFEVQPGRFIELLAFGYDLPAADADAVDASSAADTAEQGSVPSAAAAGAAGGGAAGGGAVGPWRLETVAWNHPDAARLREEMDREVGPRYADRFTEASEDDDADATTAFSIDSAAIVATVLARDAAGRAVGHAALRDLVHDGRRDLEIKRFFVQPRARGIGVSRALLAELERIGADRGADRLILQTGDRQHDAVALYEKAGYTPIPIFEPYRAFAFSQCFEKPLAGAAITA